MNKLTILALTFIFAVTGIHNIQAGNSHPGIKTEEIITKATKGDSLKWSVNFLNKLLNSGGEWYLTDYSYKRPIKGIIDFAKNDPIDTVVVDMHKLLTDKKIVYLVDRRPQDIKDFKDVKGYISEEEIQLRIDKLQKRITDSLNNINIQVPSVILDYESSKAPLIPQGTPQDLMNKMKSTLPPAFKSELYERFDALKGKQYLNGIPIDSVRNEIFNTWRKSYNDSLSFKWREQAKEIYS